MDRPHSPLGIYRNRPLTLHKPGLIPNSSRNISAITSNRHKYELKQKTWPKKTVESWFADHSLEERQAVFSFLNTLYNDDSDHYRKQDRSSTGRRQKSPGYRPSNRANTAAIQSQSPNHSWQRRMSNSSRHDTRASKRDLGEILETLESFRHSPSVSEKSIQTSASSLAVPLPDLNRPKTGCKTEKNLRRPKTSVNKCTETVQPQNSTDHTPTMNDNENNKTGRRYLSHTWRVINPREDAELNVRPENNISSFFNYTKKVYPEYFFIHPDWY